MKKGKKEYFYLEHTIRKGKTFENKRRYLGERLPENVEMIKERFIYYIFEDLYGKKLKRIQESFGKEYKTFPEPYKKKYMESFMVKFTYNSNKIEGGTLSLKETADLLQQNITPKNRPMRDVKETEAHKRVFYQMLEHTKNLNMATVLHWHRELFRDTAPEIAGKIRKHPVAIARSKTELPLPAELDSLLHDFFIWYRRWEGKMDPVIFSALVHLKFVSIHPFSDGNGRISRLMMNHVLQRNRYPMITVEYSNRNAYYTALERSQTQKKEEAFMHYLVKRYLKQHERYR